MDLRLGLITARSIILFTFQVGLANPLSYTPRLYCSVDFLDSTDLNKEYSPCLPTVHGAAFDSFADQHEVNCFPGTRVDILRQIREWAFSSDMKSIFWLNGMAGTGKSTISRTMAKEFDASGVLGASFFFKRGEGDRGNAAMFFTTLARHLTIKLPNLSPFIEDALRDDPNVPMKALSEQFDKLVLYPLQAIGMAQPPPEIPKIVIVIDGLDECASQQDIRMILHLLPQITMSSAIPVRIFVTSRPELPIRLAFRKLTRTKYEEVALHEIPRSMIKRDISTYIRSKLTEAQEDHEMPTSWPDEKRLQDLIEMAVPLFIFAAITCRFIADHDFDPEARLEKVLKYQKMTLNSKLASTYLPILDQMLINRAEEDKQELISEFRRVIGAIVLLFEPLSMVSIANLLSLSEAEVRVRLKPLHSVFQIPENRLDAVRMLHLSFRDFLLDPQMRQETPFCVDEKESHRQLVLRCLFVCRDLKRNMCALSSDGIRRVNISQEVIGQYFSPQLRYSCRYWAYHLVESQNIDSLMCTTLNFLQMHFLHWVESMSLLGLISEVSTILTHLQAAITLRTEQNLVMSHFIQDATRFIRKNRQIVDEAPLQLYCAALVFAPEKSIMRSEFKRYLPKWIAKPPKAEEKWDSELQVFEGHSRSVQSVAFSPDNAFLASASSEKFIFLWKLASGIQHRIFHHSHGLNSVAFSPDGQLLASGSSDGTIQLWDLATGEKKQVLRGHSNQVHPVAFSPDGRVLASGSHDNTICLWDHKTGDRQHTLKGHSASVNSIAFSSNGQLLGSGSSDQTICLWELITHTLQKPAGWHGSSVNSVAFSPDSQLLASAAEVKLYRECVTLMDVTSYEKRKWNTHNSFPVDSVAFSPNGKLFAYVSHPHAILIFDLESDTSLRRLLGHSSKVNSMIVSPDSRLLASAGCDNTVRLWDLEADTQSKALGSHYSSVENVVFSPDGTLLASSSSYDTMETFLSGLGSHTGVVTLWNTKTGTVEWTCEIDSHRIQNLRFKDGFLYADTVSGPFDYELPQTSDSCIPPSKSVDISLKDGKWVTVNCQESLWLPPDFRPTCYAVHGNTLALGHGSGHVSFIEFCDEREESAVKAQE